MSLRVPTMPVRLAALLKQSGCKEWPADAEHPLNKVPSNFPFRRIVLDQAIVHGSGAIFTDHGVVRESLRLLPAQSTLVRQDHVLEITPEQVTELDRAVITQCGGLDNYFHFLIDFIQTFLAIQANGVSDPMLIPPFPNAFQQNVLARLPESPRAPLMAGRFLRVRELTFVPNLKDDMNYNQSYLGLVRDTLRAFVTPQCREAVRHFGERLFISRAGSKIREVLNVAELEAIAESKGFTVIHPERLRLTDQIAVFEQARCVLGFSGAAFTNLLFSKPGAQVLEVLPERAMERGMQFFWHQFAQALGLSHRQLVMTQTIAGENKDHSKYVVDPASFSSFLAATSR